jgi:Flp pilus assembly protein TadG
MPKCSIRRSTCELNWFAGRRPFAKARIAVYEVGLAGLGFEHVAGRHHMPRSFASLSIGMVHRLQKVACCRSGATMVEFSLLAFPFLLLIMASFEVGFIYWANQELENATADAARMVRTGQVQAGNLNQAQLKTQLCNRTALLVACQSRVRLDVRSAPTFAAITAPEPLDNSGELKGDADFSYSPGGADDVVLVSAFYDWRSLFSGVYIVRAAAPVRNEPF